MCDNCKETPEERATRLAREERCVQAGEAIRLALFGVMNPDGSVGPVPPHAPNTVGELADVLMAFAWATEGMQGETRLVRAIVDRGLDTLEMKRDLGGPVSSLAEMIMSGKVRVMSPSESGQALSFAMNNTTPGMYL